MVFTLIRFLLLLLLSFTFGGFLFYASVVVPLGTDVLGSTTQGFVTRRVTNVINAASLLSAAATLIYCWATARNSRTRAQSSIRVPVTCAIVIALTAVVLVWLHGHLEAALDQDDFAVLDSAAFYQTHRIYLWVSTVQWLFSLPVLWWFARPTTIQGNSSIGEAAIDEG